MKDVYDGAGNGAGLKEFPSLVWLDVFESILKKKKVRSLNI